MVCRDTLRIKHFPKELSEALKEDFMRHFGAIRVKVITSKAKAKSIVYAKFENEDVAKNVMSRLHQLAILNCRLSVEYAETDILQGVLSAKKIADPKDVPDQRFFKNFINNINAFNDSVGFHQPPPSHLKYNYPKANRSTINNIAHALATVPRFYTQVLHLMNKMNLPPPFAMPEPPVRIIQPSQQPVVPQKPQVNITEKRKESSSESEIESDGESNKNKEIIPQKRTMPQKKAVKRPKFIKQPVVQPSVSSKPMEKAENIFEKVDVQPQRKIELRVMPELPPEPQKQEPVKKRVSPQKNIKTETTLSEPAKPMEEDKEQQSVKPKVVEMPQNQQKLESKKPPPVKPQKEIKKSERKSFKKDQAPEISKQKAVKFVDSKTPQKSTEKIQDLSGKDTNNPKLLAKTEYVVAQTQINTESVGHTTLEQNLTSPNQESQKQDKVLETPEPLQQVQKLGRPGTKIEPSEIQRKTDLQEQPSQNQAKASETPQQLQDLKKGPSLDQPSQQMEAQWHTPSVADVETSKLQQKGDTQKQQSQNQDKTLDTPSLENQDIRLEFKEILQPLQQAKSSHTRLTRSMTKVEPFKSQQPVPQSRTLEVSQEPQKVAQDSKQIQQPLQQVEPMETSEILQEPTSPEDEFPCISLEELAANQITDFSVMPVFKKYTPGEPTNKLYIKNCAKNVVVQDLEYIYNRYREEGTEDRASEFHIRLMQEGRMKGQAFVTLDSVEMAEKAVKETNGFILKDKPLIVVFGKAGKKK